MEFCLTGPLWGTFGFLACIRRTREFCQRNLIVNVIRERLDEIGFSDP